MGGSISRRHVSSAKRELYKFDGSMKEGAGKKLHIRNEVPRFL